MKINRRIAAFILAGAMVLLSGCGKKEESKTTRLVTTKDYTSSSSIQTNESPNKNLDKSSTQLQETYDYVGEPFTSQNGYKYVKVGKIQGEIVLFGLYNMDTKKEDIPCKCDMISKENKSSFTEETHVWISVIGDNDYECGLFNMTKLREDIKCNTCEKVYHEWKAEDGTIYRWLKIPNETGFIYGLFNVTTLELKLFESYELKDNSYVCTESNGKQLVINLK